MDDDGMMMMMMMMMLLLLLLFMMMSLQSCKSSSDSHGHPSSLWNAGTLGRLEPDGRHGRSSTYPTTSGSLVRGVLVTRSMDRHSRWTCRPFGCKRHCILDSMGIRWRCHVSWQAKYPCDPKARWGVVWLCRYVWMLERHAGQTTHDDIVNSPQSSRQSFGFRNEWNQRSARTYSPTFVG